MRFVAVLWENYQMEQYVKHEFILPEWKELFAGTPSGQPHFVLFASQNHHVSSMQYEMIAICYHLYGSSSSCQIQIHDDL